MTKLVRSHRNIDNTQVNRSKFQKRGRGEIKGHNSVPVPESRELAESWRVSVRRERRYQSLYILLIAGKTPNYTINANQCLVNYIYTKIDPFFFRRTKL